MEGVAAAARSAAAGPALRAGLLGAEDDPPAGGTPRLAPAVRAGLARPEQDGRLAGWTPESARSVALMAREHRSVSAAMEGGGFYNRNSSVQAAGIWRVLPLWRRIVGSVELTGADPVVIADYGSSQGRNSL